MFFIATSFISTFLPNSRVTVTNSLSIPAFSDTTVLNLHMRMGKNKVINFNTALKGFQEEWDLG